MAKEKFVARQSLEKAHQELNGELSEALELLNGKLLYGFKGAISREYAELREARLLLRHLKHPDHAENAPARIDELAWAMKLARKTFQAEGHDVCLPLFDRAAEILGIELTKEHILPVDLNKKIRNELQLMGADDADTVAVDTLIVAA
jgi:hypothetical protein